MSVQNCLSVIFRTSDVCTGQFFHVITDIILMVGCIISILIPVAEKYITRLHRLSIFLAAAETLIPVLKKQRKHFIV